MQLEDEFPRRDFLTDSTPLNARFLEQFATGGVRKTLSCLQSAAGRRPIIFPGQRPTMERESKQQHPIAFINYE